MSVPTLSAEANTKPVTVPFPADFVTMQQRFLSVAESAGAELQAYPHPLPGPAGEALATDIALFGRRDATKLLILISGTHGVEGAFGSACQCEWMAEALVCRDMDGPERKAANAALDKVRCESGDTNFSSIVSAGQYDFADGLLFGGTEPVWSNRTLSNILATYGSRAQQVIAFDLHTGAGPYGYPALLSVASSEHPGLDWGRSIFGPALSAVITGNNATTDTGIAATATGYVSEAVRQALPQAQVLPLVIECGTLRDPETMQAMRADN